MSLSETQVRHATSAAQGLINSFGYQISPDGIWSTLTQRAYDKLSGEQAQRVNAVMVAAAGVPLTARDVQEYRASQRAAGSATLAAVGKTVASEDEIKRLITGIALEEGVPVKAALQFAKVESNFKPGVYSKKADGSPLAVGLYQLTDGAIKDVGIDPPGGNKFDPAWNARVGIKYMKIVARRLGTSFDDVGLIYAGYNLGTGNVAKLQRGQYDDPAARAALANQAAKLQQGGTRQYLANAKQFVTTAVV